MGILNSCTYISVFPTASIRSASARACKKDSDGSVRVSGDPSNTASRDSPAERLDNRGIEQPSFVLTNGCRARGSSAENAPKVVVERNAHVVFHDGDHESTPSDTLAKPKIAQRCASSCEFVQHLRGSQRWRTRTRFVSAICFGGGDSDAWPWLLSGRVQTRTAPTTRDRSCADAAGRRRGRSVSATAT